jgi:hypothetical protein
VNALLALLDDTLSVDNALHVCAGMAGAACVLLWPWTIGIVFTLWGWLREKAQSDEGWFGWWSTHKAIEGATWGVGAQVAWLALR